MMLTWNNILFYIAFLGQIFIISWYFPQKLLGRMQHVLTNYPPKQYPRLYPRSIEKYLLGQLIFKIANHVIVVIGFVILLGVMFVVDHSTFADDGYISEFWPMLYGIIQFVPLMGLELSAFSQFKLMRKANTSTKRRAALRPRRLFDFVPLRLFAFAVAMIGAAVVWDLYVHAFDVSWGHDTVTRALVLIATNGLLVALGTWILRGRDLNPHQAIEDRSRQIRAALNSFLYCSIVMSAFFMLQAADDVYDMDFLDATLLSLYFTVIVSLSVGYLLRCQSIDDINFDVYKENGAAAI